jgi:hypothetical protein
MNLHLGISRDVPQKDMLGGFFAAMKGVMTMNRPKLSQQVMWAILIALLLVGCGAPAATPTSEPSPEPVVEVGDVVFDGTECTVSGSTELLPGGYSLVLKDLSEKDVHLLVRRLTDGKTFQDLLKLQSEPGGHTPMPDWVAPVVERGIAWQEPDGGEVHTYELISEGEYAIILWSFATATTPLGTWFCAPFCVSEARSE